MKSLALFDLDNTLLVGDSDKSWQGFLGQNGLVSEQQLNAKNEDFYQDYLHGTLNIHDYVSFVAGLFNRLHEQDLASLQRRYINEVVTSMIAPGAHELIAEHEKNGDFCIIISATNHLTVGAVAALFDIDLWFATELEIVDGFYTGQLVGPACFQAGKIEVINQWLSNSPDYALERAHFYSDSINDIPLLEKVSQPIAVDPDDGLRQYALDKGWRIISLR